MNLQAVEDELNVFVSGLYWEDSRSYKKWRQRAVIVTLQTQSTLAKDVESLAAQISELEESERTLYTSVMSEDEFIETQRSQRPQDSAIISIVSPLVVVKRSPKTGSLFWNDNYCYCPETSAELEYVITAGSPSKAIAAAETQ